MPLDAKLSVRFHRNGHSIAANERVKNIAASWLPKTIDRVGILPRYESGIGEVYLVIANVTDNKKRYTGISLWRRLMIPVSDVEKELL